jgi:hypothetical protein
LVNPVGIISEKHRNNALGRLNLDRNKEAIRGSKPYYCGN